MGEHTELPWVANCFQVTGARGVDICHTGIVGNRNSAECKANAEFIVRACNSHNELLEALHALYEITLLNDIGLEKKYPDSTPEAVRLAAARKAEAVIAKLPF